MDKQARTEWESCYSPMKKEDLLLPVGVPLYGSACPIQVFHRMLEGQLEGETPVGCIVYHTLTGMMGESLKPSLSFTGNLVTALLELIYDPIFLSRFSKLKLYQWYGSCPSCKDHELAEVARVSEDWVLCFCKGCTSYSWSSTYKPPRKPVPFEV